MVLNIYYLLYLQKHHVKLMFSYNDIFLILLLNEVHLMDFNQLKYLYILSNIKIIIYFIKY